MKKWLAFCLMITILMGIYSFAAAEGTVRKLPIDLSGGAPLQKNFDAKMTVYEDPSIRVERAKVSGSKWGCVYYTAFITISDASQLRTLPADDTFLSKMTTKASVMAKRVNAVLATNGDYCTAIDTKKASSYILRQGVVYRDSIQTGLDLLMIDEDGNFHIKQADDALAEMDKTMIDGKRVINAFQFGPGLVIDGEKVPDEYILDYSHSPDFAQPDHKAQRMCIAQIDDLHYMVLCCAFYGMDLVSLRDLAMELAPVKNVYVLDGGESTQFVFLGTKLNNIKEGSQNVRPVTDIIYFASAYFTD